jgi:hypothetical protein
MLLEKSAIAPLIVCDRLPPRLTSRGQFLLGDMELDPTSQQVEFDLISIPDQCERASELMIAMTGLREKSASAKPFLHRPRFVGEGIETLAQPTVGCEGS